MSGFVNLRHRNPRTCAQFSNSPTQPFTPSQFAIHQFTNSLIHWSFRASWWTKRPVSVTTPIVWAEPRSTSLVTTDGLMSTHTTFVHEGSMLPTPMPWSMVDSTTAMPTSASASAYRSCAATRSMIVSGSGPSSRMLPASTYGTWWVTHSYMIPEVSSPEATAA